MDTSDMGNLSDLVESYYNVRFTLVASFAWALYECIFTLDDEIEFVWLRPWGIPKLLYFWTRYVGMAILTLLIVASLEQSQPEIFCNLVFGFGAWGGVVTMATVSVIMILRVWAMYGGSKKMLLILCTLLTIHLTAECTIFGLGEVESSTSTRPLPPLGYLETGLNACFFVSVPPTFIGVWISRLIFDLVLFVLALYKSWMQYRDGWTSGVVELLIRDNVMAFALVLVVQLTNLLITHYAQPTSAQLGVGLAIATDVIVGSRLLLHTRQVLYKRQSGSYDSEGGDTQLSRIRVQAPPRSGSGRPRSLASIDEMDDYEMDAIEETQTMDEEQAPPAF